MLVEPEGIEDEDMKLEYWYGVMKATSELAARKEFGDDRTIIVRPTYMIGPADKTNRFIHWPIRLSKGGEILVPGKPDDRVQYADVRDIAEWMIRLIEEKQTGTFNAAGPQTLETIQEFAAAAGKTFDVPTSFVQIDDYEFLETQKISYLVPWIMPVGNNKYTAGIDNKKAVDAGLNFRDLKTTIKDTYDWWYSDALTDEQRNKYELDPQTVLSREKEILNSWAEYSK
ncbi:MAG: NAD-dependent epimerase/dehydratase family protein [Saprospiraceae bacterium]